MLRHDDIRPQRQIASLSSRLESIEQPRSRPVSTQKRQAAETGKRQFVGIIRNVEASDCFWMRLFLTRISEGEIEPCFRGQSLRVAEDSTNKGPRNHGTRRAIGNGSTPSAILRIIKTARILVAI